MQTCGDEGFEYQKFENFERNEEKKYSGGLLAPQFSYRYPRSKEESL